MLQGCIITFFWGGSQEKKGRPRDIEKRKGEEKIWNWTQNIENGKNKVLCRKKEFSNWVWERFLVLGNIILL